MSVPYASAKRLERTPVCMALRRAKHEVLKELEHSGAADSLRIAAGIPTAHRAKQLMRLTDRLLWAEAA